MKGQLYNRNASLRSGDCLQLSASESWSATALYRSRPSDDCRTGRRLPHSRPWRCGVPLTLLLAFSCLAAGRPGLVKSEFIYETAPFPSCHASTIAETKSGLVAAWFGGTHERHPDVCIWVSRHADGTWTSPVEVANGVGFVTNRLPTWNPVLFQPKAGPLLLFYKVGPSPSAWWGMLTTSADEGKTWSEPSRLPDGILGPIKNKPVQLPDGDILCGSSTEGAGGWRVHFERTADLGGTWTTTPPLNDGREIGAIQPSICSQRRWVAGAGPDAARAGV